MAAKSVQDFGELHKIVHSLKGTSGTMGFIGVFECSKLFEDDLLANETTLNDMNDDLFLDLQNTHKQSLELVQRLKL